MNRVNSNGGESQFHCSKKAKAIMLIIGISFIAANLRAPLTSVGPLVRLIRESLHISNTLAGLITTLPLFAFALFSPLVPGLARRFGTELVLFCSVILLTIGILLRSRYGSFGLFLGTAIIGLSISAGNVLMPSLIKKKFPGHIGIITGVYSVAMNLLAAIASGVSIPLAVGLRLDWTGALRIWAVLSFISILLWFPQLISKKRESSIAEGVTFDHGADADKIAPRKEIEVGQINPVQNANSKTVSLWKSPLAWQVTLYMGLQAMVFYCMVAWLPDILIQQGMDSGTAGFMLSLMQLALIPITYVVSVLAGRRTSQQSLVVFGSACAIIGLLGLLIFGGSKSAFIWIMILGIGGGFTFSLSMMFYSLRTDNSDEAARLSGMAQSVGYLLAAFGPMFFGSLHDAANSWTVPLIILIGFAVICLLAGLGASRDLRISGGVNNSN